MQPAPAKWRTPHHREHERKYEVVGTDNVRDVFDGPGPTRTTAVVDAARNDDETVIAQDEERPARRLTGPVAAGVTGASALIAVSVLYQVFWPLAQGNQFSLILFLASTLPLVFLCYRSGIRGRPGFSGSDNPTVADYVLAAMAFAVCLYP
ncbi:MAG: hypothetical protein ACRDUV_08790, partial [Pseudonocardiaceae bacterium]